MNYFEMKWRLSACRIQAGYSQAEVAEILGCSDKTNGAQYTKIYNANRDKIKNPTSM